MYVSITYLDDDVYIILSGWMFSALFVTSVNKSLPYMDNTRVSYTFNTDR